jgi:hypothetical protein
MDVFAAHVYTDACEPPRNAIEKLFSTHFCYHNTQQDARREERPTTHEGLFL